MAALHDGTFPARPGQAFRQRAWSPSLLVHCTRVPLLVVPYAPSGEQNAPGCTPDWVDDVVGFFVFGLLVFGLLVVGFVVGGRLDDFGLALDGDGVGLGVTAGLDSTTAGSTVVGSAASGWTATVVVTPGVGLSSLVRAPMAPKPPQHRTRSPAVIQPNNFQFGFLRGAGMGCQDGCGGGP